jgi:peroxiredoxin Q/BCP
VTGLEPGTAAPIFRGVTTDGEQVSLADFAGRKLILYFYPKDDTPGCTRQACSLRDLNEEIREKGAAVLGVSTQDRASHQRFSEKYRLNFPLLADTDKAVARAYGAVGSGGLLSRAANALGFATRITYIIDEQGRIEHIIEDPNCENHGEEVLKLLGTRIGEGARER